MTPVLPVVPQIMNDPRFEGIRQFTRLAEGASSFIPYEETRDAVGRGIELVRTLLDTAQATGQFVHSMNATLGKAETSEVLVQGIDDVLEGLSDRVLQNLPLIQDFLGTGGGALFEHLQGIANAANSTIINLLLPKASQLSDADGSVLAVLYDMYQQLPTQIEEVANATLAQLSRADDLLMSIEQFAASDGPLAHLMQAGCI